MKYIDADRLKAEINKRKKSLRAGICGEAFTRKQKNEMLVASEELDRFNRIIGSLQQEQQEVDLEKEIETYFKGWYMDETDQGYILHTPDDHAGLMSVKQIARHFYELGLKARKKEE